MGKGHQLLSNEQAVSSQTISIKQKVTHSELHEVQDVLRCSGKGGNITQAFTAQAEITTIYGQLCAGDETGVLTA